jgi:ABC-type dipeptide/oligopeptide/nickel transport system permease subunit
MAGAVETGRLLGRRGRARDRAPRLPWGVWVALGFGAFLIVLAIVAPLLTSHDPVRAELGNRIKPPAWVEGGSSANLLGTDGFGRDVLTRLAYGARISLGVALLSIVFGGAVGAALGIVAGYFGGIVDTVIMRLVDVFLAFPTLLLAIALAVAIGPSFRNIVIVISVLLWPRIARQVRGDALVVKTLGYMEYAGGIGVPAWRSMFTHVLPNTLPTILVIVTLELGHVILLEASLGFLGAGVPPPTPSWGQMVSEGQAFISTGWWISLFPGIAIMATVMMFNSLGDWLREYLDPRLKSR